MRERGFAPFGRSEMTLPPAAPVPPVPVPASGELRPVRPDDEPLLARLHEHVYRNHLDRYLSLEDEDPVRDADHGLRDYFVGRFGELLSPGSSVLLLDGRIAAAVIAVRRGGPRPRHRCDGGASAPGKGTRPNGARGNATGAA